MTEEHWGHQHSIVNAMKKEGLFSASTYWMDVNLCELIRLVKLQLGAGGNFSDENTGGCRPAAAGVLSPAREKGGA